MMTKFFCVCMGLLLSFMVTHAQVHGYISLGGALNYQTSVERVGLSGQVKWLTPHLAVFDQGLVITYKGTYTPSENGLLKGGSERIAAMHLLAGYRKQWLLPNIQSFFYAELSAGITAIGQDFELSPSILPAVGYNLNKHWGAFADYHRSFAGDGKRKVSLIELGITYSFGI